jgi:hypothetical protein
MAAVQKDQTDRGPASAGVLAAASRLAQSRLPGCCFDG